MPRRSRRILKRFWRRPLRAARSYLTRRALAAFGLGLVLLVSINLAVRAQGGDVHALSLGRVAERAIALGLLAVHGLRCDAATISAQEALRRAAVQHRVPVRLAWAVARTESSFIHTRISGTGAMGLMQLMPATAFELGVTDPFDIVQSADGGVRYLAQLLAFYRGDTRRAVAAYNAGLGRVPVRGSVDLPSETRTYVGRVLSML